MPEEPPRIDTLSTATGEPIVILMIGDGMGAGQLAAASLFAHGDTGQLFMQSLPARATLGTASLSGITDSAASATTLGSGVYTFNGRVGLDRHGRPVESLTERARALGLRAGVVTNAVLPHATPAAFLAHVDDRYAYGRIIADYADTQVDVLLGCGGRFIDASPGASLASMLERRGYAVARSSSELALMSRASDRIFGVFAEGHCTYERAGRPEAEPSLREMALAGLRVLDRPGTGFFMLIEGARIDMAGHDNRIEELVDETLAFDDAVRAVARWAQERPSVTLVVTADHETGGLSVRPPLGGESGAYPHAAWETTRHTNADVPLFALGPGALELDGRRLSQPEVHAVLRGALERRAPLPSESVLRPDGVLDEYRTAPMTAAWTLAGRGADTGRRPAGTSAPLSPSTLLVDADRDGLAVGVEVAADRFPAMVVGWLDLDHGGRDAGGGGPSPDPGPGSSSAARALSVALEATGGRALGFDAGFVSLGGATFSPPDTPERAGVFGLSGGVSPMVAAINVGGTAGGGDGVGPAARVVETYIPWSELYPGGDGGPPRGASVSIAVALYADTEVDRGPSWLPGARALGSASGPSAGATLRALAVVTPHPAGAPPTIEIVPIPRGVGAEMLGEQGSIQE